MRFLVMAVNEAPTPESAARMLEYSKSLQKAGVLLARDELFPPSTGARISFTDGRPTVTNGPFASSTESLDGYWILHARSREEAIEWAKRAPLSGDETIEVRQLREI